MARRLGNPEGSNTAAAHYLALMLGCGSLIAVFCLISNPALGLEGNGAPRIYTWETVGTISDLSRKFMSVRCVLKLSGSSWSLLPGAVGKISELKKGDRILAKGRTDSAGSFRTRRIYRIGPAPTAGGGGNRLPSDRQPHPGGGPVPGETPKSPLLPDYSRFDSGDVMGTILELRSDQLVVDRKFLVTRQTSILDPDGKARKRKSLRPGTRVAVTATDVVDRKTEAVKASVIRLLP